MSRWAHAAGKRFAGPHRFKWRTGRRGVPVVVVGLCEPPDALGTHAGTGMPVILDPLQTVLLQEEHVDLMHMITYRSVK